MGHAALACPGAPQYRHRLWASRLCRSVNDKRVPAMSMSSSDISGAGRVGYSGWRETTGRRADLRVIFLRSEWSG